jgi:hypothetical protein
VSYEHSIPEAEYSQLKHKDAVHVVLASNHFYPLSQEPNDMDFPPIQGNISKKRRHNIVPEDNDNDDNKASASNSPQSITVPITPP